MAPSKRAYVDLTGDDDHNYGAAPVPKRFASSGGYGHPAYSGPSSAGYGYHGHLNDPRPSYPSMSQRSVSGPAFVQPRPPGQKQDLNTLLTQGWDDLEVIDLTQDVDPVPREDRPKEFYGSLDTKIVGVRYYQGYALPGEFVLVEREPMNQYDSNAIVVSNVVNIQMGHLPRAVASKLAPYMDRGDISVEGVLTGEKDFYDCPIKLNLYGPSELYARLRLEDALKKDRLLTHKELQRTRAEAAARRAPKHPTGLVGNSSNVHLDQLQQYGISMTDLLELTEAVELPRRDAIKSLAMSEKELANLPMADQPEKMRAQLLPYQRQGLAWMMSKENPQHPAKGSEDSVQLWQWHPEGRGMINLATNYFTPGQAGLLSGGILADDMGLGKTIQVISLIISTAGSGPTLIVAPVSVMSNWEQQIQRHVAKEHLPSVLVYHTSAGALSNSLGKYDVVITSYGKLTREKGTRGPLMSVKWRRVVLDEGHTIRNAKTNVAQAACQLTAKSRWVLTGTPIINNVKDLQSMLAFLHITGGIEKPQVFNSMIARPLSYGDPTAEALLQNIMGDLCLRRHKEMEFVDLKLPPKTEYVHRIAFRPDEKARYDALLDEAKGMLTKFRNHQIKFSGVLERLLRLRQMCNHWTLCRKKFDEIMEQLGGEDVVALDSKNRAILQDALRVFIETQEDCPICFEPLSSPVITHCKHVYCRACIVRVIAVQRKCPMCRNDLGEENLIEPAPEVSEDDENFDAENKSSKTEALLKILEATCKDPKSKVVIFSQWTSFLNIIQAQATEAGYKCTRIDGTMKTEKRDAAIAALDEDAETRIMLASLSVCSVGLNLVSADTVILADSWWAPAIEDQAVDRVHRLGQTRPTRIWRLVMEDSVEERVLDVQATKRELVGKAFQEKTKGKKTQETRVDDVLRLLS